MGAVVLGSLPDVLRKAGVRFELWPGYETRSRSTGGFEALLGIGHHHDAITAGVPEVNRSRSGWDRLDNANRPVGNARLNRDGTWVIGSLMATNTQGRGPSLQMSKGVIPADRANLYMFSIEPSNDGSGEVWPHVQTESLLTGTAAITLAYGLQASDSLAHFETAPGRKVDPAGPSAFSGGRNAMWDMHIFRARLAVRMVELINAGKAWGIAPPTTGGTTVTPEQYDTLNAKIDTLLQHARTQAFRQGHVNNVWRPQVNKSLDAISADVKRLADAGATVGPES